jgi:acyl-CoA reductase-like NAD-dependent aldehyde dehydrogenase
MRFRRILMAKALWIGGKSVDGASDEVIEVIDPATEQAVDTLAAGIKEDARRAIDAAHEAFPSWRSVPDAQKAEVKAGTICINDPLTDNDAGPFAGMKLSGTGRELGEEGIDEFREMKHAHWDFSMEKKTWWYPYEQYNRVSGYLEG